MLLRRVALSLMGFVALGCGGDDAEGEESGPCVRPTPTIESAPLHTPRWAFEPWISKDISDGADTRAFVKGFQERDMPVGVVVLDSPWETNYNTFIPNPTRYPEFAQMVSDLAADEIRVVLWTTQMVNTTSYDLEQGGDGYDGPSPNFAEGEKCGFFVEEGLTFPWWKGDGAGVDFTNPQAMAWWHEQQDPLFEMGVNGFKLDFGEDYIKKPELLAHSGTITHQEYSEAYYRDFYDYGVKMRGKDDFVTMVRPYDKSYSFTGRFYARPEHAPVAWVGDNRRDFIGLSDALDHIFRSAQAGYQVVGSDIGGYLDRDDKNLGSDPIPFDQNVFARWTALGALTPFMQLHGRANITPWTVEDKPDETVAIYRYYSWLHHELVPFFHSLAIEGPATGTTIIRPIGDETSWPDDYRFELGDAFLVAPVLDATNARDVTFPTGAKYYDFFQPALPPVDGGTTLTAYDTTDQAKIPLFVKEGAIVPLVVSNDVTGLGNAASAGLLTLLVYPGANESTFVIHDTDEASTTVTAKTGTIGLTRALTATILRVRLETAPASVMQDGTALTAHANAAAFDGAPSGQLYDATTHTLLIKLPASTAPTTLTF